MLSNFSPSSLVSPRFAAIQATANLKPSYIEYDITFEKPEDIGELAPFLKTNWAIAREGGDSALTRDNLRLKITAAKVGEDDCPVVSITHEGWTSSCGDAFLENKTLQGLLKAFAQKLPLPEAFQEYLEMAAHNATVWKPANRIELSAGLKLANQVKLLALTKQQGEETEKMQKLEGELSKLKASLATRAAKIESLETLLRAD